MFLPYTLSMQSSKQFEKRPNVRNKFFTRVPPFGIGHGRIADHEQELYETKFMGGMK
jgi:hypothetical protein